MAGPVISIPIDRIHLYEENPRHERMTDPEKIRAYLCKDEQVLELAQSISAKRTNPLELIGVVRIDEEHETGEPTYEVWEGNRRVCALQLLNDPELAPAKWKKRFKDLAASMEPIKEVEGRVFEDRAELRFWMQNIHNGAQEGRGRKDWGPDEQHRDNPTRKNAIAFDLLERAQRAGLISKDDREGKLTTLQRYVGSKHLRPVLRADDTDPGNVVYNRPDKDLTKLLRVLIRDLKDGEITSRKNDTHIAAYAARLEEKAGLSSKALPPSTFPPVEEQGGGSPKPYFGEPGAVTTGGTDVVIPPSAPPAPDDAPLRRPKAASPNKVKQNQELHFTIEGLAHQKLAHLYYSICRVSVKDHAPLIAIGCWSFLESVAKLLGAKEDQPFPHYFNSKAIQELGFEKKDAQAIIAALKRLAEGGNVTKHHAVGASFDSATIVNDMATVSPMIANALKRHQGR